MTRADEALQEAEALLRAWLKKAEAFPELQEFRGGYQPFLARTTKAFLSRSESAPAAPAPGIALPEWRYDPKHSMLYSSNFTHDAALHLTGDFADDAQRTAYASQIVAALNALNASGGSASTRDEHIVAALEAAADRSALAMRERCAREAQNPKHFASYVDGPMMISHRISAAIRAMPLSEHDDGKGEG